MRQADLFSQEPAFLNAFLGSPKAPTAMPPLLLDGYLAGILLAPSLVRPSVWLDEVWGDEPPQFDDIDEANAVLGAIMARYNAINAQLDPALCRGPEAYPLPFDENDIEAAQEWSEGFVCAMGVAPEAWDQIIDSQDGDVATALISPFVMLACPDSENNPFFIEDESERASMLRQAATMLRMAVVGLARYREMCARDMLSGPKRRRKKAAAARAGRESPRKKSG